MNKVFYTLGDMLSMALRPFVVLDWDHRDNAVYNANEVTHKRFLYAIGEYAPNYPVPAIPDGIESMYYPAVLDDGATELYQVIYYQGHIGASSYRQIVEYDIVPLASGVQVSKWVLDCVEMHHILTGEEE